MVTTTTEKESLDFQNNNPSLQSYYLEAKYWILDTHSEPQK